MRKGDTQLGGPFVDFKDTKANIEALSGVAEGARAYATDTNQSGSYNGASWDWLPALDTDGTLAANSDSKVASQKATKTYADAAKASAISTAEAYADAGLATKQDSLGYTAENSANKSTNVNTDQASNTKYPSVKAVYDWVVGLFQQIGAAAGGDLSGTYPNPSVTNASVISKVLTGFSASAGTISAADSILSAVNKLVGNIALKLTANASITGATKTKITYDANGLVTSGADIAASDLPSGIDAAKIGGGGVSNTEFGYLDGVTSALQTQIDGKQASLGYTAENSANKSTDVNTDQASNTKYPSVKAVYDWATGLFQLLSNKDATGGYAGLTLFKINFKNVANTFTSFFTNSNTAARTYTFQNRDGTIADDTDLALKAPLASPTLTGTPAAPTAAAGTNTTQIATTAFVVTAIREKLSAARTYYVRTDGSDSNTGLANTSGGAFLTIQKAVDTVYQTLDLFGYAVTIQVADGTYTGAVTISYPQVGSGSITIQGNSGTPANVIVSTTSANCFYVSDNAVVQINDMELRTTTSGRELYSDRGAIVKFQNIRFGTCAQDQITVGDGAKLTATGNYSIVGSAGRHFNVVGGILRVTSITITLSGTPAFSTDFTECSIDGQAHVFTLTFSGSATGKRYSVLTNAAVNTAGGGANYFPGNSAGTTDGFGVYS